MCLNTRRRLKSRKRRLALRGKTRFWLRREFSTSSHFYSLPSPTSQLVTGDNISIYGHLFSSSELVCSTSWRIYFLGERPAPELLTIALTRCYIIINIKVLYHCQYRGAISLPISRCYIIICIKVLYLYSCTHQNLLLLSILDPVIMAILIPAFRERCLSIVITFSNIPSWDLKKIMIFIINHH